MPSGHPLRIEIAVSQLDTFPPFTSREEWQPGGNPISAPFAGVSRTIYTNGGAFHKPSGWLLLDSALSVRGQQLAISDIESR